MLVTVSLVFSCSGVADNPFDSIGLYASYINFRIRACGSTYLAVSTLWYLSDCGVDSFFKVIQRSVEMVEYCA